MALALELKTATGHVTLPQQAWLEALAQCTGVHAQVIGPPTWRRWWRGCGGYREERMRHEPEDDPHAWADRL